MSSIENMEAVPVDQHQPTKIPTAYVMWLTMRSRFIDEYAEKFPDILIHWKEYEDLQMQALENIIN